MATKKNKGKKASDPLWIGVGVIALVFAAFQFFASKKQEIEAADPARERKDVISVQPLSNLMEDKGDGTEKERLRKARMQSAARFQIGMVSLKPVSKDSQIEIPVEFVPRKLWCSGGDLDTIRQSLENVVAENLLVSVESLSDLSNKAVAYTSYLELLKGRKFTFRIKTPERGDQFGLFICEDSKKEKSCQNKTLLSSDELSKMNSSKSSAAAQGVAAVFYFQHLIADDGEISTFDANQFLGEKKDVLFAHLKGEFDLSDKAIQKGWHYSSVVKSLPTEIQKNTIKAPLTYADTRCGGRK